MNWLILLYSLTLSWMPIYNSEVYTTELNGIDNNNLYFVQLDIELDIFNYFFIDGKVKTGIRSIIENHTFMPLESSYSIGVGFQYKNIKVKADHICIHSMAPFEYKINYDRSYNAMYEEISISISN